MVCFRYISVNALHKGDDDDNNNNKRRSVISGFRHVADEICALLEYNAAPSSGYLFFLKFLTLEDATDTLPRNVGKGLPLDPALYPRTAQLS
jgi:hypothetical protein